MKKVRKQLALSILAILCVVLLGVALIPLLSQGIRFASAATGTDNVYSKANTYNATVETRAETINGTTYTYQFPVYNMSTKNGRSVSSDAPQVTFLTHGLGGNASHWSNSGTGTLAYSMNSIIELLKLKSECNVYLANFRGHNSDMELYLLNADYSRPDAPLAGNKITENTKHSIVLFQADKPSASNDFVYAQFDLMASTIIENLRSLDRDGRLPRVNLIGHSRGGQGVNIALCGQLIIVRAM